MPADASIYSMIRPPAPQPGPLDNYGTMLQLRNMIDTGQLNDLQRQKLSGDLQEEQAFKSKIADWVKAGGQGNLPTEAYAASPSRAAAFDKTRLEGDKTRAELSKTQMEVQAKAVAEHRDQLAGVNDPQAAAAWLAAGYQDPILRPLLEKYGGPLQVAASKIPQDPQAFQQWKQQASLGATKFIEMNKPQITTQNLGGTSQIVATPGLGGAPQVLSDTPRTQTPEGLETARHNVATEEQAREAAKRDRRQIVTDTEGNITVVDKDSLVGRPATDAEGNVLKGRQNMTESQGKAAGMAMRAREAQTILNDLEAKGVSTRGLVKQGVEGVPLIGEGLAMGVNKLPGALGGPSGPQQQVEQARRNFVNAVLRVESGASINESEFRNAEKQYFPMPGDLPAVVAQKKANRETAIRSLELQSGPQKSKNPMAAGGGSVMAGKRGIKFLGFE